MENQHVPGPWVAKEFEPEKFWGSMWNVSALDGRAHVCALYGIRDVPESKYDAETAATARLIASAPELLECLILAVQTEERNRKVMIDANKEMGFDEPKKPDWLIKAEATIKKATEP